MEQARQLAAAILAVTDRIEMRSADVVSLRRDEATVSPGGHSPEE